MQLRWLFIAFLFFFTLWGSRAHAKEIVTSRTLLAFIMSSGLLTTIKLVLKPIRVFYLGAEPELFLMGCYVRAMGEIGDSVEIPLGRTPSLVESTVSGIDIRYLLGLIGAEDDEDAVEAMRFIAGAMARLNQSMEKTGLKCLFKYIKIRFFRWLDS